MTLAEFVDHLRLERARCRVKQRVLAEEIGVKQSQLSGWECARTVPSDGLLRRWAAALDVPVPDGVTGYDLTPAACGTDSAYNRHLRNGELPDDACKRAHRMALADWRSRRRLA